MLHRIVSHSTGLVRRTRAQHNLLLFAGSQQPRFLQPIGAQSLSVFRNLSTNNNNGSNKSGSSLPRAGEKAIEKDKHVNDKPSSATSNSTTASSADTGNQKLQQSEPQAAETTTSSEMLSSTISAKDTPSAPVSGEAPTLPPALANYYDKAFQLWSERSGAIEIQALKESVNEAGTAFDTASAAVTTNRRNLDEALRKWERASGQHMQLLQRRESWTPEDAQRFADFVSLEITSRAELEQARHDLGRSEELLTKSQLDYINKMRRRYHEEQIWQDQWRVLGTYGTWTLICLNSCVFLGSQYFQRRRERERMETIERLITENRIEGIREVQSIPEDQKASESLAKAVVIEDEKEQNVASTTDSIEESTANTDKNDARITESEEEHTGKNEDQLKSNNAPISEQEDTSKPSEPKHPAIEKIEAAASSVGSFVKRWGKRLPFNAKEVAGTINQKLRQALPAEIANEMPKSVSEINVPSAVIGASAALTITMIFSAFTSRR